MYEYGRIILKGGDDVARDHYTRLFATNQGIEIKLILELAKSDELIWGLIEERAAIRGADGLPDDFENSVRCNFQNQ